jgi:hypothetical protein
LTGIDTSPNAMVPDEIARAAMGEWYPSRSDRRRACEA